MFANKRIIITGGEGRFAKVLKFYNKKHDIYYPSKKTLNVLSIKSIETYLKKIKPKYLIHCAALSRPINICTVLFASERKPQKRPAQYQEPNPNQLSRHSSVFSSVMCSSN